MTQRQVLQLFYIHHPGLNPYQIYDQKYKDEVKNEKDYLLILFALRLLRIQSLNILLMILLIYHLIQSLWNEKVMKNPFHSLMEDGLLYIPLDCHRKNKHLNYIFLNFFVRLKGYYSLLFVFDC